MEVGSEGGLFAQLKISLKRMNGRMNGDEEDEEERRRDDDVSVSGERQIVLILAMKM